ncbi:MAG: S-layer homology domain-containing protein [Candidatus Peregrinibacteria bacterium]
MVKKAPNSLSAKPAAKRKAKKNTLLSQFFTSKFWKDFHAKHFKAAFLDAENYFKKRPVFGYMALMLAMIVGVSFLQIGGQWFKASIVEAPLPFDGATMPFQEGANWYKVGGKNTKKYSEYSASDKIPAPEYNLTVLQSDATDADTVNAKITYSIVYSGAYKFDHQEYEGSHPGVDIKMPEGTPIFAIANGVVVKSATQSTGFGYHIVVQHDKVPGYGTVFSSYSHLSAVDVPVGKIVKRGEKIGNSGTTGASTTPHLHFQIDQATAPFHPYWPFTSAEAAAAGVSFNDAIDKGVGKENVKTYTINPFELIKKNRNDDALHAAAPTTKATPTATPKSTPVKASVSPTVSALPTATPPSATTASQTFSKFVMSGPSQGQVGNPITVTITALDTNGNPMNKVEVSGIPIFSSQGSGVTPKILNGEDFKNGKATVSFTPDTIGSAVLNFSQTSINITIEGSLKLGNANNIFTDVSENDPHADAIRFLKDKGITTGYSDGSFQPNRTVSRVESLLLLFKALEIGMKDSFPNPFPDISEAWKIPPVATAFHLDIAKGYSDGTFQPDKEVNRVEYFKILLSMANVSVPDSVSTNPFADTPATEWYAPYASVAKDKQLLDFDGSFAPSQGITRGEVAESLYRLLK